MFDSIAFLAIPTIVALMIVSTLIAAMRFYKRCKPNEILVISGKTGGGKKTGKVAKVVHGGAAFVVPLLQEHEYMDARPMITDINLRNALSQNKIRVNVPSNFTFAIDTRTPESLNLAAINLLGQNQENIKEQANEIIYGQLRATIATMDIEEIIADREKFEQKVVNDIEKELEKIGLYLINVNISDITDDSGYIEALGKQAAAEVINRAKKQVAEQDRDGEIGAANAKQEERVSVASADAKAITGENQAAVIKAQSDADRREAEAEAKRRGDAAVAVKAAEAETEGYAAEKKAEYARAEKERATQNADVIVPAEIAKQRLVIEASAAKEQQVLAGQAEGESLKAKLEGEAEGLYAILSKQAEGITELVQAAGGNAKDAAMLLIVQQMPELVKAQTTAISNIDFEKIVVFDGGSNGGNTTANWLSGITKTLPGLHEFASMAGLELPELLGKKMIASEPEGSETEEPEKNTSVSDVKPDDIVDDGVTTDTPPEEQEDQP